MGGKTLDQFRAKQKSKAEKDSKRKPSPAKDTDNTIKYTED